MTATPTTIETLVRKAIDYERTRPTNPDFYDNPVMACGWQTERWFKLCTEIVYGFLANELGKTPVREYAIYSGTPGTIWSTQPEHLHARRLLRSRAGSATSRRRRSI